MIQIQVLIVITALSGATRPILVTGSIENNGFHLTIVAADGDGAIPLLRPLPNGGESGRPFRSKEI